MRDIEPSAFRAEIDRIIATALAEDMPEGDITSDNVISSEVGAQAVIRAKEKGILAGIGIAERVFHMVDERISFSERVEDGSPIKISDILAEVEGPAVSLLKGERTALNFLQRLSGIATLTRRFVTALKGSRTRILDTRKTTPGLRILEKYAVKMGGGYNHRMNLSEMAMLKDNHIKLAGSITAAVQRIRERIPAGVKIEVETTNLDEVKEALSAGADMIMLDNMTLAAVRDAVAFTRGKVPLEVSGNVDLAQLHDLAAAGVDYISVGRLTHSYESLDISMDFL